MPTPITEFLNGGLVTARHPALLNPGELQLADDCVYRDKNPSIQRAPARTAYNSIIIPTTLLGSTAAGIKGLAQLTFDQNIDQILAWPAGDGTSSYLYRSNFTALTGEFLPVTGPGTIASCVTTISSTNLTAPAGSFSFMLVGTKISGVGIAPGTYVDDIISNSQLTLSQNATANGTVTLAFDAGIPFVMSDTGNEVLDIVQWQSTYFLLPKVGPVTRLFWKSFSGVSDENLILRSAGLYPVNQFTTTNVTIQTGTSGQCWSSVLGSGYYWFLLTEILAADDPNLPGVESGYIANDGRAIVANVADYLVNFVRITFPTLVNDGTNGKNRATHWGVYMSVISPGKAAYDNPTNMPSAATFRRILRVDVSETSKDIRFNNVAQGINLPTTTAAGPDALPQFTNPTGMFTRGGVFASAVSGGGLAQESALAGFGFSTGAPWSGYTVTGIEVTIVSSTGFNTGKAGYYLWLDNNAAKSSNRIFGISERTTMYAKTWGGPSDNWGVTWVPADIGALRVVVLKSYSASSQQIFVDYIEVKVYYVGGAADTGSVNLDGPPYQVVTYRSQIGTTVNDPVNYIIPSASTGDIFQGSLVLNDVSSPSTIRYSLANAPESFPKPYFIKFDSKNKDIVTYIRRIGQILIVGMRDSIKRVNYLPTEVDADFGRGVAHEDIVVDHGIVGPHAAVLFDLPGIGVVCAYASYNGFNYTDGISTRPFNLDLDFASLVKTDALSTSILRVYPKEKWLVFYYCPNGATHSKNTRAIVFHYQTDKLKEGSFLPATGPISISARSVTQAKLVGVPYILSGHQSSGFIYVEDNGVEQPSDYQVHDAGDVLVSAPIIPSVRTRKIYPSGYSRDTREQRVYLLHDEIGDEQIIPCTTTSGSDEVTSTAFFTDLDIGFKVKGVGIQAGTIVAAKLDDSTIILSQSATSTGTVDLTFDDGTISITVRGSGISEPVSILNTRFFSTVSGDLVVSHQDNYKQGLELQIEKVYLSEDVRVDLNQAMRIYNFTYLADDAGTEMNRAS